VSFVADGNLNSVLLFNLGVLVACLVYGRLADPAQWHHRIIYCGIVVFLLAAYLFWRSTETLPAPELSLRGIWPYAFYLFETLAIVCAGGYVITFLRMTDRSAEADAAESELLRTGRFPTVDVFICTYDEPLSVLEKSIVSAQFMNYPCHTVYVCDDTRRPEIKDYCDRIGVNYLTRSDNRHAKAGNLNNALRQTNEMDAPSELIMVLDADFAVEERFLQRVVGMFRRSEIGIVQTPQFFYNSESASTQPGHQKDIHG